MKFNIKNMIKNKYCACIIALFFVVSPVSAVNWKQIVAGAAITSVVVGAIYYLNSGNHEQSDDDNTVLKVNGVCDLTIMEEAVNNEIGRYNSDKTIADTTATILAARTCDCNACSDYNHTLAIRLMNEHRELLLELVHQDKSYLERYIGKDLLEAILQQGLYLFFTKTEDQLNQDIFKNDQSFLTKSYIKFFLWFFLKKELYSKHDLENIIQSQNNIDPLNLSEEEDVFNSTILGMLFSFDTYITGTLVSFAYPDDFNLYVFYKEIIKKDFNKKSFDSFAAALYAYFRVAGDLYFSHIICQQKIQDKQFTKKNKELFDRYIKDRENEIKKWCYDHMTLAFDKKNNLNYLIDCADVFGHRSVFNELSIYREAGGQFRKNLYTNDKFSDVELICHH